MKKLFFLLAACLFILPSCEPDPVLSLDKSSIEFSENGGSQTVAITANNDWTVTADNAFYSVSPTAGSRNGYITVTAQPNTTSSNREATLLITCASRSEVASQTLNIKQFCAVGEAEVTSYEMNPVVTGTDMLPAEGGTITLHIEGNAPWLLSWDAQDVKVNNPATTSFSATVVAEVPACPVFEGRTITFTLNASSQAGSTTNKYEFKQAGGLLVYGGEIYQTVKMKDGKWWMAENLRYIPAGMTPSDDKAAVSNGIWYPLVIDVLDASTATVKFSKDAADIKANGYLYSTEVALGLKPGDITTANAGNYEGVQGICPAGWHIPTVVDILGLVGKSAGCDTNPNAPYYDPDLNGGNGSVALLNADGFNAGAWGAVSIANAAAKTGALIGAIKAYQKGVNTGYIAGSSLYKVMTNDDGSLKNVQFFGFMPNMNNGVYNGAFNNYRNGVSVRCVKNN